MTKSHNSTLGHCQICLKKIDDPTELTLPFFDDKKGFVANVCPLCENLVRTLRRYEAESAGFGNILEMLIKESEGYSIPRTTLEAMADLRVLTTLRNSNMLT